MISTSTHTQVNREIYREMAVSHQTESWPGKQSSDCLHVLGRDSIGGPEMALDRSPRHGRHQPGVWRNGGGGGGGSQGPGTIR